MKQLKHVKYTNSKVLFWSTDIVNQLLQQRKLQLATHYLRLVLTTKYTAKEVIAHIMIHIL